MQKIPSNKELGIKPTKAQKRVVDKICSPEHTVYMKFAEADSVAKAVQQDEAEGWEYTVVPHKTRGWTIQIVDAKHEFVGFL